MRSSSANRPTDRRFIAVDIDNASLIFRLEGEAAHTEELTGKTHHKYELCLAASGNAEIVLAKATYTISQNDMFIISPGTKYKIHAIDGASVLSIGMSVQQKEQPSEFLFYEKFSELMQKICNMRIRRQTELIGTARNIMTLYTGNSAFGLNYRLQSLLTLFTFRLYDNFSVVFQADLSLAANDISEMSKQRASDIRAAFIDAYLYNNLSENITLTDLAQRLSLSPRQLNRIIRSIYGKTFHAYLTDLRIERAKRMLTDGATIEDIAFQVGYSTQMGFYNAFRKLTGLTPGKYRAEEEQK